MTTGEIPATVEVAADGEVRLPIRSAAGAGYLWELIPLDSPEIADVRVEPGPPPARTDPPSSGEAPLALVVAGRNAGEGRWRLRLVRPWARETPLVSHDLTVTVSPAP